MYNYMYLHNWNYPTNPMGPGFSAGLPGHEWIFWALALAAPFILLFVLWTLVWKGLALWHSARRGHYWWFVILLVVNTLGILEIIYLFFVAGLKFKELFSTHSHGHDHSH